MVSIALEMPFHLCYSLYDRGKTRTTERGSVLAWEAATNQDGRTRSAATESFTSAWLDVLIEPSLQSSASRFPLGKTIPLLLMAGGSNQRSRPSLPLILGRGRDPIMKPGPSFPII